MSEKPQKSKLDVALAELNKKYGKGTIVTASQKGEDVPCISTGSFYVDIATGIGGFPLGRIVEIIGPESSGKTTLCLHTIAEAQKGGKKAAFIDMEHALDVNYAKNLGVNIEDLLISQPDYGEQALNIARVLIETGEFSIIIIDSIASLVPKSEIEGEVGDATIGKQARMMSQGLRILTPIAERYNTLIIFTNQIRMKIGVMYGSPETGAGGEAMKFYASMRVDVRRSIDKENEGNKTRVKIIKNKLAAPFKDAEIFVEWGKGINRMKEIMHLAIETDIIRKAGSWYSYGELRIGQGEDSVKQLFLDNPDFYKEIEIKVLETIKPNKNEIQQSDPLSRDRDEQQQEEQIPS